MKPHCWLCFAGGMWLRRRHAGGRSPRGTQGLPWSSGWGWFTEEETQAHRGSDLPEALPPSACTLGARLPELSCRHGPGSIWTLLPCLESCSGRELHSRAQRTWRPWDPGRVGDHLGSEWCLGSSGTGRLWALGAFRAGLGPRSTHGPQAAPAGVSPSVAPRPGGPEVKC